MTSSISLVASIAALRELTTPPSDVVFVEGYYTGADGGEGQFWYDASDITSADNSGTIIVDAGGNRWYRETGGQPFAVAWFGAKGDGSTDDHVAINKAISVQSATGGLVTFQAKTYVVKSTIELASGVSLSGLGATPYFDVNATDAVTQFLWAGAAGGTVLLAGAEYCGLVENMVFDGAFIAGTIWNLGGPTSAIFRNVTLTKNASPTTGFGIYIEAADLSGQLCAGCKFDTVVISNVHHTAFYASGMTDCTFINCNFSTTSGNSCVVYNQQCDSNGWIGGMIFLGAGGSAGGTCLVLNYDESNNDCFGNNFYNTIFECADSQGTVIDARNNQTFNHFFGCYLSSEAAYTLATTNGGGNPGQVKFWGCQFPQVAQNFTDVATVSVGASPFTYTNGPDSGQQKEVMISGGTVTSIVLTRNAARTRFSSPNSGLNSFLLEPGDSVEITYSVVPSVVAVPH